MSWYTSAGNTVRQRNPEVGLQNPGPPPTNLRAAGVDHGIVPRRRPPSGRASPIKTSLRSEMLLLVGLLLAAGLLIFYHRRPAPASLEHRGERAGLDAGQAPLLLNREELSKYDGKHGLGLFMAVMGEVYDVSAGKRHYGLGGGYHSLAGKDASRSLATGNFVEDLHDDIHDFSNEQIKAVLKWRDFYHKSTKYHLVGHVVGAFYDADGRPTPLLLRIEALDGGRGPRGVVQDPTQDLQPCNSGWSQAAGTEVWCDTGYPRKVMTPGPGEELRADCVCQRGTAVTRGRRLFTGCLGTEQRCRAPELDDADDGDL
uniref:Cytochrome b5 heme-binding domain-containing protein n=2 Tax=Auxenochlorella protothecoides TaxID=3075 RepID=A0A1D2AF57_AUXPR